MNEFVGYIQGGYCTPNGPVEQCEVAVTQGGKGQGSAVATQTTTYYLCKSTVSFCDSDGQNAEGTVNVANYGSAELAAAILNQNALKKNAGTSEPYAAGWQVNQWTVEVSKTLPESELDKVEESLASAVIIMNQGYPAPFHAERVY